MKSLFLILSVIPLMATAQSRKVQFEIDSSLYSNAESVTMVLDTDGDKDTLDFDGNKSLVFQVKSPCTGHLVLTDDEFWYRDCSFSILELQEDSLLLLVTEGRNAQPIFLTSDALQVAQTVHLPLSATIYGSNNYCPSDSTLLELLELSGGIIDPIGADPVIRGNRGDSGLNIYPKSVEKPVPLQETDLPGVAPEFENKTPGLFLEIDVYK